MISDLSLWVMLRGIENLPGFYAGVFDFFNDGSRKLNSDLVTGQDLKDLMKSYALDETTDKALSWVPDSSLDGNLSTDKDSSVFYNYVEEYWQFSFLKTIPCSYLPYVAGARLAFHVSAYTSRIATQLRYSFRPDFECFLGLSPTGSVSIIGDLHSIWRVWESDEFLAHISSDDLEAILKYWSGVLAVFQTPPQ